MTMAGLEEDLIFSVNARDRSAGLFNYHIREYGLPTSVSWIVNQLNHRQMFTCRRASWERSHFHLARIRRRVGLRERKTELAANKAITANMVRLSANHSGIALYPATNSRVALPIN
jgi:hypothetical protein